MGSRTRKAFMDFPLLLFIAGFFGTHRNNRNIVNIVGYNVLQCFYVPMSLLWFKGVLNHSDHNINSRFLRPEFPGQQ